MKSSLISMESVRMGVVSRPTEGTTKTSIAKPVVQMLRGRAAILAKSEMLEELCRRTDQAGMMSWLEYQMGKPTEAKKIPTVLLIGMGPSVSAEEATADDVLAAVMVYEYKAAGCGLKLFATDDMTGLGTVIAPVHQRIEAAEVACGRLMELGALSVLVTFAGGDAGEVESRRGSTAGFRIARRVRSVPLGLTLETTLEETLAGLGKHTRRNLRYYRRRAEMDLGTEFVPQVEMSRSELLGFNRASMNPVSNELAGWRYDSAQGEQRMMFAGMRARDGRWLSLMGGRRDGDTVYIDWQMNRVGLARYSLSTVMRSYVLEHESSVGTRQMIFTGGTPHSMRHSFDCVDAIDVVAVRDSMAGRMLRRLSRWVLPGNFLGQTLRDPDVRWE